jgi:hypothetical protein
MFRTTRLAALALAAPAFSFAQTPMPMPTTAPAPMPMTTTAPVVAPPAAVPAPAVIMPDAGAVVEAEPEAPAEDKFLVEKILGGTSGGQQLLENGWRLYGWTQLSYTTGSVRRSSLPVPFIDRVEKLSLNQNYLRVEKNVDTSKQELQIGGAADLILPGTDGRFTISRGLLNSQLGKDYPIDLFQAYVDVFAPGVGPSGTTFRLGKFATFLEYETVQAISTPFLSRSYLFQYNPFTHTGGMAITPLNDDVTMSNGFVLGSDNFIDPASRFTYIGQLKWAPKEGKSSLAFGTQITNPRFDAVENFAFYNVYNLQFTHKFTDKLQYILDTSFSHMDDAPLPGGGTASANWYGFVNYLLYDVSDTLQSKARLEFFEDTQGVRTGTAGLYTALTYGLTWKPAPWLWVTPEVRYDHASRGRPFEGNQDMFTATIGTLIRW